MLRSQIPARGGARLTSPLLVNDLCAQMVSLNRYGLPGVGAAIASAVRSLTGASRTAVCPVSGCGHRS